MHSNVIYRKLKYRNSIKSMILKLLKSLTLMSLSKHLNVFIRSVVLYKNLEVKTNNERVQNYNKKLN